MSIISEKTNAVSFGDYGIYLLKEQLFFYSKGDLMRVRDVTHEFSNDDLMKLATNIAEKQGLKPMYTTVNKIAKK